METEILYFRKAGIRARCAGCGAAPADGILGSEFICDGCVRALVNVINHRRDLFAGVIWSNRTLISATDERMRGMA